MDRKQAKDIIESIQDEAIFSDLPNSTVRQYIKEIIETDDGETFTVDGDSFRYFLTEDEAERTAVEQVKQDLENEPSLFTQSWLRSFVYITDTDKRIIANEEADFAIEDRSDEELIEEADRRDNQRDWQDEYDALQEQIDNSEDENQIALLTTQQEKLVEDAKDYVHDDEYEKVKEALDDPIDYFVNDRGIYTVDDLMKASFISIDTNEASQDAVNADGWAHFLSRYDGNYYETTGGIVYFKE